MVVKKSGEREVYDEEKVRRSMNRVGAVSYTHLRAHETVLDLVCRLLLEKKKNKTKTTEIYKTKE